MWVNSNYNWWNFLYVRRTVRYHLTLYHHISSDALLANLRNKIWRLSDDMLSEGIWQSLWHIENCDQQFTIVCVCWLNNYTELSNHYTSRSWILKKICWFFKDVHEPVCFAAASSWIHLNFLPMLTKWLRLSKVIYYFLK